MHLITFSQALRVQRTQLDFYSENLSPLQAAKFRALVRMHTQVPDCGPMHVDYPVREVNRLVPRGVALEGLLAQIVAPMLDKKGLSPEDYARAETFRLQRQLWVQTGNA